MPYIKLERRNSIRPRGYNLICANEIMTTGDLNFAISTLLSLYTQSNGTQYKTINDILGALEGAKLEFYRRVAVPYEEQKIKENGDIY